MGKKKKALFLTSFPNAKCSCCCRYRFYDSKQLSKHSRPDSQPKPDTVFMSLFREINPKQGGSWKRRQWERGEVTCSLRKKKGKKKKEKGSMLRQASKEMMSTLKSWWLYELICKQIACTCFVSLVNVWGLHSEVSCHQEVSVSRTLLKSVSLQPLAQDPGQTDTSQGDGWGKAPDFTAPMCFFPWVALFNLGILLSYWCFDPKCILILYYKLFAINKCVDWVADLVYHLFPS